MRAFLTAAVAVFVAGLAVAADPPKDTTNAAFTRTKKLKGKVTVEAKNEMLKDIFKDISDQLDNQKLGALSVAYDIGLSQNTRTTVSVKDATAEEALDKLLKTLDYGYVVVSKDKDRYDGWIKVVKGTARGYEGTEVKDAPKPGGKPDDKKATDPKAAKPDEKAEEKKPADPAAEEDEKTARAKVDAAKKLLDEGHADDAKPLLKYVVKFFAKTKAAEEAKKLLDGLK